MRGSRATPSVRRCLRGFARAWATDRLILGVDRLDYSKGIPLRLRAFERFLETYPEWRARATFLQVTPKSRSAVRQYEEIENEVAGLAGRINGRFGDATWTPIRYVNMSYSRTMLAGLYRCADVAMVTPVRDGMNLVAKEFVAAQIPSIPACWCSPSSPARARARSGGDRQSPRTRRGRGGIETSARDAGSAAPRAPYADDGALVGARRPQLGRVVPRGARRRDARQGAAQ